MDDAQREELEALVVAYLTSGLKENPSGVTLNYFISSFPEKSDEPADWYKRFKARDPLEALKSIPSAVRLSQRGGSYYVSLNHSSDKVDSHLVDLVTHQRSSASRRRRPTNTSGRSAAQRAVDSFTLNRRYSGNFGIENRFGSRYGQDYHQPRSPPSQLSYSSGGGRTLASNNHSTVYRYSSQSSRPTVYNEQPARAIPGDPRARQASSTSMVPPQVRPMSASSQSMATPSKQAPPPPSSTTTSSSSIRPVSRVNGRAPSSSSAAAANSDHRYQRPCDAEDPAVASRSSKLRKQLVDLLTLKFESLKLLHLPCVYREEYKEELDPKKFGYKTIVELLRDYPYNNYIKVIQDHPHTIVKAINVNELKENFSSKTSNSSSARDQSKEALKDKSNSLTGTRAKYDAINPFNVRAMLQSLDPISDIKGPTLGKLKVEDTVKYRTMRLIFKSPDMTLKLDEWELKYQLDWNCNMRVPIQDYGFRTLLEFFKHLAKEIPIKIRLQNDEWVAKSDYESVSKWLNQTMKAGNYRAIMVMDKRYDSAATPNEEFTPFDVKTLKPQDYYPVTIMSIKHPLRMWLQFKTKEQILSQLTIESSLTSYEDYKRKGMLQVPREFLKIGFPCVAFDDVQQRWCRASITKVPEDENAALTVFLVDYGITRTIKRSQLLCILKSHLVQPVCIIYAELTNVKPEAESSAKFVLAGLTNPPVQLACKIHNQNTPSDKGASEQEKAYLHKVTLIDTRQGDRDVAQDINANLQTSPDDQD